MAGRILCRQLAEAVSGGESPTIQKIFEALVNDDEAKVLLAAAPPATTEELGQKTGLPQGTIRTMMESLFNRGLIFKAKKGEEMKYYRVKNIPQMHDATALTLAYRGKFWISGKPIWRRNGRNTAGKSWISFPVLSCV